MLNLKTFLTHYPGNLENYEKANPRIIGIEKGEDSQLKDSENAFNKIIDENFPNLKRCP